jgi:hypothetical protein
MEDDERKGVDPGNPMDERYWAVDYQWAGVIDGSGELR